MRGFTALVGLAFLGAAAAASADVRGPEGDRGFRYVYPVSASAGETEHLYHADLKALAHEATRLEAGDGGNLTDDHRAYLETRRSVIERRYAEATGRTAS